MGKYVPHLLCQIEVCIKINLLLCFRPCGKNNKISMGCCGKFTLAELTSFTFSTMIVFVWIMTGMMQILSRTTDTRWLNPKFIYLGLGYKDLLFCKNIGWLMGNMDKGLTEPKWVLINWPKIPQTLSAQKFGISMKKGFIGRP